VATTLVFAVVACWEALALSARNAARAAE